MTTSVVEIEVSGATTISITEDTLTADLADGRTIAVPLVWYPRLVHATPEERSNWELHAAGQHLRWPDLDEDLSVEGLLAGRKSGESHKSFKRWLEAKRAGRSVELYDLLRYEKERSSQDPTEG